MVADTSDLERQAPQQTSETGCLSKCCLLKVESLFDTRVAGVRVYAEK